MILFRQKATNYFIMKKRTFQQLSTCVKELSIKETTAIKGGSGSDGSDNGIVVDDIQGL